MVTGLSAPSCAMSRLRPVGQIFGVVGGEVVCVRERPTPFQARVAFNLQLGLLLCGQQDYSISSLDILEKPVYVKN